MLGARSQEPRAAAPRYRPVMTVDFPRITNAIAAWPPTITYDWFTKVVGHRLVRRGDSKPRSSVAQHDVETRDTGFPHSFAGKWILCLSGRSSVRILRRHDNRSRFITSRTTKVISVIVDDFGIGNNLLGTLAKSSLVNRSDFFIR